MMKPKKQLIGTALGIFLVAVLITVSVSRVRTVRFANRYHDDIEKTEAASTIGDVITETAETEQQNEVLQFFFDKYDGMFRLWGPEEQSLHVFYMYPDHAERECHILMPENTDDVSEYHTDLSWEVVDNELRITGEWHEVFTIDISMETATSAATGKVYQICEMQLPLA